MMGMEERASLPLARLLFGVIAFVVLAWLAAFAFQAWERSASPQNGGLREIVLRSEAGNARYALIGSALKPVQPAEVSTTTTFYVREAGATLPVGTPVIGATSVSAPPRIAALVAENDRLTVLAFAGSVLRDIAVRPDGVVAFSSLRKTVVNPGGTWHVETANTLSPEQRDLGVGSGPVFAKNGHVVAFSQDGLVEIDPATGMRTVILAGPFAGASGAFLIAPDASFAVVPNSVTGAEDVFMMNPARPADLSYAGSLPTVPEALGAMAGGAFVAKTAASSATEYTVSSSGLKPMRVLSIETE